LAENGSARRMIPVGNGVGNMASPSSDATASQ